MDFSVDQTNGLRYGRSGKVKMYGSFQVVKGTALREFALGMQVNRDGCMSLAALYRDARLCELPS